MSIAHQNLHPATESKNTLPPRAVVVRETMLATRENFEESAYLEVNPDVATAVRKGEMASGRVHFEHFGEREGRRLLITRPKAVLAEAKARKLSRIEPLLRTDMPFSLTEGCIDFLTPEFREKFNIVDADVVSSNEYDRYAIEMLHKHREGIILDCGSGRRDIYYDNVVNFEIVNYDTTDVRGVAEVLPFNDNSFDAVLSLAVLEHVKDPFACAREIIRVLKPGGELLCCVPLLQPVHAYPHHYYNMTAQGLQNLFSPAINITDHLVYASVLPIWSLTWIVRNWADGLTGSAKEEFLNLRLQDLMGSGEQYLQRSFVQELPVEKNFELASATVLFGTKKTS